MPRPAAGRLPPQRRPGNHGPRASCCAWRAGGPGPGAAAQADPEGTEQKLRKAGAGVAKGRGGRGPGPRPRPPPSSYPPAPPWHLCSGASAGAGPWPRRLSLAAGRGGAGKAGRGAGARSLGLEAGPTAQLTCWPILAGSMARPPARWWWADDLPGPDKTVVGAARSVEARVGSSRSCRHPASG